MGTPSCPFRTWRPQGTWPGYRTGARWGPGRRRATARRRGAPRHAGGSTGQELTSAGEWPWRQAGSAPRGRPPARQARSGTTAGSGSGTSGRSGAGSQGRVCWSGRELVTLLHCGRSASRPATRPRSSPPTPRRPRPRTGPGAANSCGAARRRLRRAPWRATRAEQPAADSGRGLHADAAYGSRKNAVRWGSAGSFRSP